MLAAFGFKDQRIEHIISLLLPERSQQVIVTSPATVPTGMSQEELVVVKRVIDGDTIGLVDGRRLRYIGINAPELSAKNGIPCFGKEATEKNRTLVEEKTIRIVKDTSETDKYGRILRYVWVGDVFINELLVRQGFAQVSTYPPDVAHKDLFIEAQRQAKENKKGLWGGCPSANDAVRQ